MPAGGLIYFLNCARRGSVSRTCGVAAGLASGAVSTCRAEGEGDLELLPSPLVDDEDFGPLLIKVCSYAPWGIELRLNGHEWARRQPDKRGIGFQALDDGFLSCTEPEKLQQICDSLRQRLAEQGFVAIGHLPGRIVVQNASARGLSHARAQPGILEKAQDRRGDCPLVSNRRQ